MKMKDDEFFDDLDKTTDLLKAFKPSIEKEETKDLQFLYEDRQKVAEKLKEEKKQETLKEEPKKVVVEPKKEVSKDKIDNTNKTEISSIIDKINSNVEENKKQTKIKNKEKEEKEQEVKKTKKKNEGILEVIFCSFSALFIIGCCCVYGSRLVKYYKIYNPKNDSGEVLSLLTTAIAKDSPIVYEGTGLYMQGGDRVYKGENVNNYIEYSNMKWRILKMSVDGTIDIVLDDYINVLPFSSPSYKDSDVNQWLNKTFIKYLDQDYLTGSKVCTDTVDDINGYTCEKFNTDNKVRLLSVSEFLNSKDSDGTYLSNKSSTLWLHTVAQTGVWQINGTSLSIADASRALGIKPVVTLKVGVALLSGKGTLEDPYKIQKDSDKIGIGDYVKLGQDVYVVYSDSDNKLYLALNSILPNTYRFDLSSNVYSLDNKYSLAYYLNNVYYNTLSYKDLLLDNKWDTGVYTNSYKDIESSSLTAKVGLLSLNDLKFNNELSDYFMLNGSGTGVYLYGNELVISKTTISRRIRPCIVIKSVSAKSGNGTIDSPYVVEG